MYIESLEIVNFKNLRHLQLDTIPKLVVLAGPNGSGKTSVFDALRIFKEAIAGYSIRNPMPSRILCKEELPKEAALSKYYRQRLSP